MKAHPAPPAPPELLIVYGVPELYTSTHTHPVQPPPPPAQAAPVPLPNQFHPAHPAPPFIVIVPLQTRVLANKRRSPPDPPPPPPPHPAALAFPDHAAHAPPHAVGQCTYAIVGLLMTQALGKNSVCNILYIL